MDSLNPTAAIGRWLATPQIPWSEAAKSIALRCITDTLGCMLAGSKDPAARAARAPLAATKGPCTVVGTRLRLPAPWAALANGTAAHALDFDENYAPAMAHASAVLLPALLAVGEAQDVTGPALVDAFLAGLEVMACVGFALNPVHRQRGWHATATVGAVGAAAAVARLLRLDAAGCNTAMSLATSQAAGSMLQFGHMAKPLHAGLAAQAGVLSALWAEAGLSANSEPFLGAHGMQRLWIGPDLEALQNAGTGYEALGYTLRLQAPPAEPPFALERLPPILKLWPNCASAHPAMQAALALRNGQPLCLRTVVAVEVHTREPYLANLMYRVPADAMQARFSLEFGMALMLARGDATLADFGDPNGLLHALLPWMQKVQRHPLAAMEAMTTEARVVLRFVDGSVRTEQVNEGLLIGDVQRPLSDSELHRKFIACATHVLSPAQAERALAAALGMGHGASLAALARTLKPTRRHVECST